MAMATLPGGAEAWLGFCYFKPVRVHESRFNDRLPRSGVCADVSAVRPSDERCCINADSHSQCCIPLKVGTGCELSTGTFQLGILIKLKFQDYGILFINCVCPPKKKTYCQYLG